ncbi:MAG: hypothetical protein P8175_14205, partial [Deltaproteobacteria bacterium]
MLRPYSLYFFALSLSTEIYNAGLVSGRQLRRSYIIVDTIPVQKRFRSNAGAWGSLLKNEGKRAKTLQKGAPKAGGDP